MKDCIKILNDFSPEIVLILIDTLVHCSFIFPAGKNKKIEKYGGFLRNIGTAVIRSPLVDKKKRSKE